VVELADGKGGLMLSMRNYLNQNRRAHALSHDGGAHWDEPVLDSALPDPVCQASILRYSWPKRGSGGQILFANPAGPKREKMTVRLSPDDGQTWPISRLLDPNPGAYSCLAALPDSTIACLYECGEKGPYERIVLARFTLAWLKDSTRNQASFFSRRFSKIELQRCNSARELHT
jgi:sialidase-1